MKCNSLILLCLFITSACMSQVFLRLDEYGQTESLRFIPGDEFEIKQKNDPDTWIKKRIESFIPHRNTVIFDQDFMSIDDIIAIRFDNKMVHYFSRTLKTFGTAWLGIGALAGGTGGTFSTDDLMIGLGSLGAGIAMKKLGKYKVYILGEQYQLRMIDARLYKAKPEVP